MAKLIVLDHSGSQYFRSAYHTWIVAERWHFRYKMSNGALIPPSSERGFDASGAVKLVRGCSPGFRIDLTKMQLQLAVQLLPIELKRIIMIFTFVLQMKEAFCTDDLEEMAQCILKYHQKALFLSYWFTALVRTFGSPYRFTIFIKILHSSTSVYASHTMLQKATKES